MKLAFLFNTPFVEYNNKYYSINLTKEFWETRYLHFFDQIVVVGRVKHVNIDPEGSMARSDMEGVTFKCIENSGSRLDFLSGKTNRFLEEVIKECDAVICRNWWGTSVCRKLKKPYMIEVITNVWDSLWYHSTLGKIAAVPNYLLQRMAVKKAPFVLYVSKFFLQEKYPTNGKECGCPDVWLEIPSEDVLQRRLAKIEKMKNNSVTIGLIGSNSVGYRGQDTLIRSIRILRDKGIECQALFLGSGDPVKWEKLASELSVADNVKFCGSLPHGEEVLEWIDGIDVLIMPTRAEALGRAVIEAMSRGCPVLGTFETGIREQIGSDCLFHTGDDKSIANLVEQMIANKDYMKYCARENFYRSFKYTNEQTDLVRNRFYKEFADYAAKTSITCS